MGGTIGGRIPESNTKAGGRGKPGGSGAFGKVALVRSRPSVTVRLRKVSRPSSGKSMKTEILVCTRPATCAADRPSGGGDWSAHMQAPEVVDAL